MINQNKKKILNDPVYGFITIPNELIFDLVEHPFFQRLRRIKQLGLSELVYPGALHTRFHHALGAMHLMGQAIQTLRSKGHSITDQECEAAQIAILLHDLGHGPFSHVLEYTLLEGAPHEQLSLLLMHELNRQFQGALDLAIQLFEGSYERPFFHQLISSQLDMDRMDYLNRDCFYTGVAEGTIGADRLIKMLDLIENKLVIEAKGILSIENFLNARRLMYWQVYLHKTSLCAEAMLDRILQRARFLISQGKDLLAPHSLFSFLSARVTLSDFQNHPELLKQFVQLDDYDIWSCIKLWCIHPDRVLSILCTMLLNRRLFKILLMNEPIANELVTEIEQELLGKGIQADELPYFIIQGEATNAAYLPSIDSINIKLKNNQVIDIADVSDISGIKGLTTIVRKHYVCWAKTLT